MDVNFDPSGHDGVLSLGGELTIDCAEELRQVLLSARREINRLEVRLHEVSAMDVSCLQLFCAAHCSFRKDGKTIALNIKGAEWFRQFLEESGYHVVLGETLTSGANNKSEGGSK